jgi:hypothetical protein
MGEQTTEFSGELNFMLGEENSGGHVYDPDMFEKAIIKALDSDRGLPVTKKGIVQEPSDIIGFITSYDIKDNKVTFNGKIVKDFELVSETLTIAGVGSLDGNEVTHFEFGTLFPAPTSEDDG